MFLEFPVMILPAKTPDGHSMPNRAKAFWAFFFLKKKKTFQCWECVELLKRVILRNLIGTVGPLY